MRLRSTTPRRCAREQQKREAPHMLTPCPCPPQAILDAVVARQHERRLRDAKRRAKQLPAKLAAREARMRRAEEYRQEIIDKKAAEEARLARRAREKKLKVALRVAETSKESLFQHLTRVCSRLLARSN